MPNLTDAQRRSIIDELLKRSIDGELPHGTQADVDRTFERVVGGEWQSRIKQNSGRKRKDRAEIV
ncbi:hypothetical protein PHMEG_00031040 [Phytophthora megakarya]|uniref:Uncharacterized protein n=1 Tax=Phytophthora megakarya TaxID=4795 RepID=A0A225V1B2_9STRA|nr:hypothetical protein PHMEG_00031040 [Phytophthora megakarya]